MAGSKRYEIGMYQRISAVGATPFERISTMYLGSLRIGKQGLKAVRAGEADYAAEKAQRLQAIIQRLNLSLDHTIAPELCDNLSKLYGHMLARLEEDEANTNPEIFEEVLQLLETLWNGFQEAQLRTED
mgnify:CR=1 FL=1